MRNTRLEVNLDRFINNINQIKKYVGDKEIMPVIKGNGYGTYINKRLDILNMFKIVGVAFVDEAIEIRKLGYRGDILVLNQPYIDEVDVIEEYNITIGLSDKSFLLKIINGGYKIKVHLEIETGMNRTGISLNDLEWFLEKLKNTDILIDGVYSHLSSADYDKKYTAMQIDKFKNALDILKNKGTSPRYIHISASNGIINYEKLDFTNLVRPGIIMYGYESFYGCSKKIAIEPICKLISHVTFIKGTDIGDAIGYSQNYKCKDKRKIATIPIGYADGYRRSLSNKGYVLINGYKCYIVGNVCMDSFMVDITDAGDISVGDQVIIFDNENIKLEEIAEICDTINYEILSNISYRVPRVFVGLECSYEQGYPFKDLD